MCVYAWVPFYSDVKSFIAYCAWMENRIYKEDVIIESMSDNGGTIRFRNHLWFAVYNDATHLKTQLDIEKYTALFEYIWYDRAENANLTVTFDYAGEDTVLFFSKRQSCSNLK